MRSIKGFTLVEMMVVVAIIGILVAIAYPNFADKAVKSRRSDAYAGLQQAAATQERWFASKRAYSINVDPFGSRVTLPSPEGYYTISSAINGMTYTLTATPVAGGAQASDSKCATLTLTSNGKKSSTGTRSAELDCWR